MNNDVGKQTPSDENSSLEPFNQKAKKHMRITEEYQI